jgi:hypothetical protein
MATSLLRLGVALVGCFVATLPVFAAGEVQAPLTSEFTRRFVGHTVGDEAHWSYHFTNAAVDAMDLRKTRRGLWRFTHGSAWILRSAETVAECYEILISGKNVRFLRDGVLIVEGWLVDEVRRNIMKWITRERPKIDRIACPWLVARFIDKARSFSTSRPAM